MLGIDKNINSKDTAHVQAPKQDCANRTGPRMHVVWRVPYKEMFVTFPRAPQTRAEKLSTLLVMFIWKTPFMHPLGKLKNGEVQDLLK